MYKIFVRNFLVCIYELIFNHDI